MTIIEALNKVSAANPNRAVSVDCVCWRRTNGRLDITFSVWDGYHNFEAATLEGAVSLALSETGTAEAANAFAKEAAEAIV